MTKRLDIHDIIPYVGSYCADHGRYNLGDPDWFPYGEWEIIYQWACDFGKWPEGVTETQVKAAAMRYVGINTDSDPDF